MAGATIKIIRRVPEAGGSEMKNAGARAGVFFAWRGCY